MENEETKEKGLELANVTRVTTDLFGESKSKRITSLDLTNEEDIDLFLNSQSDADFKLNDEVGKTIKVVAAIISEHPYESQNEETGEVITRKKHALCLIDEDGKTHVTGSGSCYYSFAAIISLKGMPTKDKPLDLTVIKVPAKEKGHEYLRVKLAK